MTNIHIHLNEEREREPLTRNWWLSDVDLLLRSVLAIVLLVSVLGLPWVVSCEKAITGKALPGIESCEKDKQVEV